MVSTPWLKASRALGALRSFADDGQRRSACRMLSTSSALLR